MKTTAAIAMTLMAVAIAAPSQAIEAPAERAAPGSLHDNGLRLNGFRLNGLRLNGFRLNGLAAASGSEAQQANPFAGLSERPLGR